jgi:hypothetical protein
MLRNAQKLEFALSGEIKPVVKTHAKKIPFQKLAVLASKRHALTDLDTRLKKSNPLAKVASVLQVS